MSEEQKEIQSVNWRKVFGFLEIMRTFRMAVHPAKLVLCLVGVAAMFGIGMLLDCIPGFATADGENTFLENTQGLYYRLIGADMSYASGDPGIVAKIHQWAWGPVNMFTRGIELIVSYWQNHFWFALVYSIIGLAIWALVGGAITRMAAVQVARDESIPLKEALAFSAKKWPSLATSPLIPFVVLVVLGLIVVVASVLVMIPYLGEIAGSVFFALALIAGVIMALIFIGGAFSVGLQWPTIGAEGSDSFDAISRSISYISSRPWRYIFYTAFSAVYACLTFVFVHFVVYLTLYTTRVAASVGTWGSPEKVSRIWQAPEMSNLWQRPVEEAARSTESVAAVIIGIWVWLLIGVMFAFLVSFFFSSQTVIYFLLRRLVDSTDIEEVYLEEAEGEAVEHAVEEPKGEEGEEQGEAQEG